MRRMRGNRGNCLTGAGATARLRNCGHGESDGNNCDDSGGSADENRFMKCIEQTPSQAIF